jgi:polysaccharide biosynthesis transport protein
MTASGPDSRGAIMPLPSSKSIRTAGAGPGGGRVGTVERVLHVARRNVVLILLCLILVPAAALGASQLQQEQYTATASLLFRDPGFDQTLFNAQAIESNEDPERQAATNIRLVSLEEVAERTARALNDPNITAKDVSKAVEAAPAGPSDLINVSATDPSAPFAARMANTFASQYIAFRRDADRAKIRETQQLVQSRLDELSPEERLADEGQELEQSARQLEILQSLQTGNAELAQRARVPDSPSSPKTKRNIALGILLGIVLAVGLTLLREQFDRRVRDAEDVLDVLDLPVLASIPESRGVPRLAAGDESSDAAAGEAFLMLRANLQYFNVDEEIKTILVTSAAPQEGKTTVSWNLARAEARSGKRVLFLEADLRRPTLARQIGTVTARGGLALVLAGVLDGGEATVNVQGVDVIPAGPLPPNPAELMESQRMRDLLHWAEQHYDRVIVDTPPTSVVADAIPLVTAVHGVVVVVRLGRSRRDSLQRLWSQLSNTNAPVLGVVLNGAAARRSEYYYGQRPGLFGDASDQLAVEPVEADRPASAGQRRAAAGRRADSA